jgi:hypothetical protein
MGRRLAAGLKRQKPADRSSDTYIAFAGAAALAASAMPSPARDFGNLRAVGDDQVFCGCRSQGEMSGLCIPSQIFLRPSHCTGGLR